MAQQAKDIYSGIKKIFPSSRRSSGSFSFSGRSSSTASAAPSLFGPDGDELSAAAASAVEADPPRKERRKKERRPSFSFSSWGRDKHRSSTSHEPADASNQVVMSLPYGAQAATPKGYLSPSSLAADFADQNQPPNVRYNEPSASVTSASAKASGTHAHAFSSSSLEPPRLGGRSVSVDLTPARSGDGRVTAGPSGGSTLLHYSGPSSSSRSSRRSRNSTNSLGLGPRSSTSAISSSNSYSGSSNSGVRGFSASVSELAAPSPGLERASGSRTAARRDNLHLYRQSVAGGSAGRASLGSLPTPQTQTQAPPSSSSGSSSGALLTPEKPKHKKKERRTSLSFTSSRRKTALPPEPSHQSMAALRLSSGGGGGGGKPTLHQPPHQTMASAASVVKPTAAKPSESAVAAVVKPHAATWDSDSDDDYEDSKRPTRGLDRRSQSMDFMEQAPTHLISKIWRKLPIQARLIGGRGSIDLDLQKDRNSFSRSSNAKQLREQQRGGRGGSDDESPTRRPPSPVPDESNVFGDKRIRFSRTLCVFPEREDAATALESYDEVLVRVCRFAAHDKRRTATKVQEFLERSMAFLHGTRTKHGNVVSISNEEIRMWRRLALHDWALEDPARVGPPPPGPPRAKKDKRSSSSVSTAGSDDSDENSGGRRRPPAIETMSEEPARDEEDEVENEEEEEDEEDLKLPRRLNLSPLREVVNCCVGFGERVFSADELEDLVRLEFLVEEDGWI